jgi:hypothetical protein
VKTFRRSRPDGAENAGRAAFVDEAEKYIGYRCRLGTVNEFGRRVGYSAHDAPWDGAFLDCVAHDAGLVGLPSVTGTVSGLSELVKDRRIVSVPLRGDLVFFAFPVTGHFTGPHVGVVVDGSRFATHGEIDVLEAQVPSPMPRAPKDPDGIYVIRRSINDVLMFARPNLRKRPEQDAKTQTGTKIPLAHLRATRANDATGLVQKALLQVLPGLSGLGRKLRVDGHAGLSVTKKWDGPTRRAFARYQRSIGFVGPDATGEPELRTLQRLGLESGLFSISE